MPTTKKLQFKSGTPLTDHLKAKSRRRRENLGRLAASSSPARASRNDLLPPLDLAYIPLEDLRMPAREIRKLDPRARARGRQFAARADVAARKPKKRWPFQAVPVIALAICERLA